MTIGSEFAKFGVGPREVTSNKSLEVRRENASAFPASQLHRYVNGIGINPTILP